MTLVTEKRTATELVRGRHRVPVTAESVDNLVDEAAVTATRDSAHARLIPLPPRRISGRNFLNIATNLKDPMPGFIPPPRVRLTSNSKRQNDHSSQSEPLRTRAVIDHL